MIISLKDTLTYFNTDSMEKSQIAIYAAVFVVVAYRLYKKYGNKNKPGAGSNVKPSGNNFPASVKDDDYEPYSKK
jgi:hypothetical protein